MNAPLIACVGVALGFVLIGVVIVLGDGRACRFANDTHQPTTTEEP